MHTAEHHDRTTAYRVSDRGGDGDPILFVHGSGGAADLWKSQFRLSDQRPVVALDLSGHGESDDVEARPGFQTCSAYTDDILAVADATDATVFVGNSMGGAVLLHAVLERDFDPEGLVLAGTGARLPVLDDLLDWLESDFERAIEFLHAPGRLFADPDERLVEGSAAAMRNTGQTVTERDFRTCHTFDVRDRLDEVTVPALAVVGTQDQLTPPWYHEQLAEELPDCGLAKIEDAGHLAMLERPEAFNTVLERFLNELS